MEGIHCCLRASKRGGDYEGSDVLLSFLIKNVILQKTDLDKLKVNTQRNLLGTLLVLFTTSSCFNAQGLKKIFGPTKKELIVKIDSLDSTLKEQRSHFLSLLNEQSEELINLSKQISLLEQENGMILQRLDTTSAFLLKKEAIKAEEEKVKNRTGFCPENSEVEKIERLKECSCYAQNEGLLKTDMHGYNIVSKGIEMVADTKELVRGSCWNYIDKVYKNAGYDLKDRKTIYKGRKGSLINDISLLQPGDWIYHINHSFHGVEHSAIFMCWKDKERKIGITLSHVGQNKLRTGQFGSFDLKSVYNIIRANK